MKKVLILSPFFYPEKISTGKYNTYLAKELVKQGYSVDVLCSHPIYPNWKPSTSFDGIKGVNIFRGGQNNHFPKNQLLRRIVLEIWFLCFVFFNRKKLNDYSHIIPIFPPSLFMLAVHCFSSKSKIVGIVHDLQGVYASNGDGYLRNLISVIIRKVEKLSFNSCDKLIFLSESMMSESCRLYSLNDVSKSVAYPFITIEDFTNHGKLNEIFKSNNKKIVYSGALGDKQCPQQLVNFFERFIDEVPGFDAYIFSQGPIFESLRRKDSKVNFFPLVDEELLPELLLRSDIQVIPQQAGTSDGSLPSKLPNIIASGTKLLCITDEGSELVSLLSGYRNAITSNTWDVDELIKKSKELNERSISSELSDKFRSKFKLSKLVSLIVD